MTLRILVFSLFSFALGLALFALTTPVTSFVANETSIAAPDDRAADREAIRAHIDRIFQAFIKKDAAELRATHEQNWLGYLEGSRTMIRGVDGYMNYNYVDPSSPYGMKSYKMREFDMIFKGDAAFVCFTAEIEAHTPNGPLKRVLRIVDFYTKQAGKWIQTGSDTELHPESVEEQQQTLRSLPESAKKKLLEDGGTKLRSSILAASTWGDMEIAASTKELAEKAYRKVCFRSPTTDTEHTRVRQIADNFKSGGSLRSVFAETAASCAGGI